MTDVQPTSPSPEPGLKARDEKALAPDNSGEDDRHQREAFAHAVAFGVPIPHALRQSGYVDTTPALGYYLLRDEAVTAIIDEDRAWMREKMKLSQEQIIAQLDNDRAFAYTCGMPAAAVAATMAKAKVAGMADPMGMQKGMPRRVIVEWGSDDDDVVAAAAAE